MKYAPDQWNSPIRSSLGYLAGGAFALFIIAAIFMNFRFAMAGTVLTGVTLVLGLIDFRNFIKWMESDESEVVNPSEKEK